MEYVIEGRYADYSGALMRSFLRSGLGLSSGVITRLKKLDDGILCNGERVTVRRVLQAGDRVSLHLEDSASDVNPYLRGGEDDLVILFEDDGCAAVYKRAGMPTHPSLGHRDDSLASSAAAHYSSAPFVFRPVNRLDRDTSGIVLIAKDRPAAGFLSAQMEQGNIRKQYLAFLEHAPRPSAGRIDLPIARERESIITRCVREDGDRALTEYRTLMTLQNGLCAVEASPLTGRTHQLRVHFSAIGCPLAGDDLYGGGRELIARQALHAFRLRFVSPASGEVTVSAPLPDDMEALLTDSEKEALNGMLLCE